MCRKVSLFAEKKCHLTKRWGEDGMFDTIACRFSDHGIMSQASGRNSQKGFTLLELMIVMSIIGVLALYAVPLYKKMVVRAQVAESVGFLGSLKAPIVEYYAVNNAFPGNVQNISSIANDSEIGNYTDWVWGLKGFASPEIYTIISFFNPDTVSEPLDDIDFLYMQTTDGGQTWSCGPGAWISVDYYPYLPTSCRTPINLF